MKKYKVKKFEYPLEHIVWCDAIENVQGWHSVDEAVEWGEKENWYVNTVGYVIESNKNYLLVASEIAEDSEGMPDSLGKLLKVPTTWIMHRKKLK